MSSRALIVEDDLTLRPLWESLLKRRPESWILDWAISSEEGRRLCLESVSNGRPYSLLVVDLFLAGSETGLDFLASKDVTDTQAPVILVSAIEENKIKANYLDLIKNTPTLSKPLNIPKCERVLDQIFSKGNL